MTKDKFRELYPAISAVYDAGHFWDDYDWDDNPDPDCADLDEVNAKVAEGSEV